MAKEYSPEEVWKLYEKIPEELKEAIFSEETAESIWRICTRNGIEDEKISGVARFTGRVLLGLLPPNELQETLEKELNLEKEVAESVAREIQRYIFYPVRIDLAELYKMEITPPTGKITPPVTKVTPPPEEVSPKKVSPKEEKPSADVYREPIE
jgi:hypothetical protein